MAQTQLRRSPRGPPQPTNFELRVYEDLCNPEKNVTELRPKNCGVPIVYGFKRLALAVLHSTTVKVLYLQSQPYLDDEALRMITVALQFSPSVTGINLGELPNVTQAGWDAFIQEVPSTGLIDCYAQPAGGGPDEERCVQLKQAILYNRMRDKVTEGVHKSMWRNCDYH